MDCRFVIRHLLVVPLAVLLVAPACSTGATGVEACRSIETHRCNLLSGCPGTMLSTKGDVEACKLFYRDQCLHGLADGATAGDNEVTACLNALDQARACANAGQTMAACSNPPGLAEGVSDTTTGCSLLQQPEQLSGCSFLVAPTNEGSGGASPASAGAGGTGGSAGGSSPN